MMYHEFRKPWFLATVAAATVCAVIATLPKFVEPKYMATLRAEGFPISLKELDAFYTRVPDEENAALLYLKAFDKYSGPTDEEYALLPVVGEGDLSPIGKEIPEQMLAGIRDYLNRNSECLEMLRQAAKLPDSRYPGDYSNPEAIDRTEHYGKLRELARLLCIQTLALCADGDIPRVLESVEATSAVARSLNTSPVLIAQLVSPAIWGLALYSIEEAMNRLSMDDAALRQLARILEDRNNARLAVYQRTIRGETAYTLGTSGGPPKWRDLVALTMSCGKAGPLQGLIVTSALSMYIDRILGSTCGLILYIRNSREMLHAGQDTLKGKSSITQESRFDKIAPVRLGLYFLFLNTWSAYPDIEARYKLNTDLFTTGIALERFHLQTGSLPDRLEALVPAFLKHIPHDHYSDGPIQYRKTESGYLLYSVGRNGRDDAGLQARSHLDWNERDDIAFSVSRPDLRKENP